MLRFIFCLFLAGALQGCATLQDFIPNALALNVPDKVADVTFPAQGREMRILRAHTFMAGAAQVGATKFTRKPDPAKLQDFIAAYKEASAELKEVSECMRTPRECGFETAMRGYYHKFKKVAGHLVSKNEWKQIASARDPMDFFESPTAIKTIVVNGLAAGGDIGAVYRDAADLRMDIALETLEPLEEMQKKLVTLVPNSDESKKLIKLIELRAKLKQARARSPHSEWDKLIYQVELNPKEHHYERVWNMMKMTCRRVLEVQNSYINGTGSRSKPDYSKCFGPKDEFYETYKAVYKPKDSKPKSVEERST